MKIRNDFSNVELEPPSEEHAIEAFYESRDAHDLWRRERVRDAQRRRRDQRKTNLLEVLIRFGELRDVFKASDSTDLE